MDEPEFLKNDGDGEATTRIQVFRAQALLAEMSEGTTVVQRRADPPVGWVQGLLNWFREEFCIFGKG